MIDFSFMLPLEMLGALVVIVVAARYLRHLDKPKQQPASHYRHTNYYIDKAVIVNADPSRPAFQFGRNGGISLPAAAMKPLPYWRQRMLEEGRPFKNAPEAEKQAFARRQDAFMRGGH